MSVYELHPRFRRLFDGLDTAFGTGEGRWVKRPPNADDFVRHLQGEGPGIGIAPLRPDNTVKFAAIDLDEPDFEAAKRMQKFIPGTSFIERSRSGNAHVWVFFRDPIEAWIPMGVLREVILAAGKEHVEVFPKNHDFTKVRLGNYINLPFHGKERPVVMDDTKTLGGPHDHTDEFGLSEYTLEGFISAAEESLNNTKEWRKRAQWMMITAPEDRQHNTQFGSQNSLHICADHIISGDSIPVMAGHRAVVYFSLAKCLTNWKDCDHDEALGFIRAVNEVSPDPISDSELRRILGNAERGEYTSTGCDDPLFAPYAHPSCPIANPRS